MELLHHPAALLAGELADLRVRDEDPREFELLHLLAHGRRAREHGLELRAVPSTHAGEVEESGPLLLRRAGERAVPVVQFPCDLGLFAFAPERRGPRLSG